jgi:hypothetical protein
VDLRVARRRVGEHLLQRCRRRYDPTQTTDI